MPSHLATCEVQSAQTVQSASHTWGKPQALLSMTGVSCSTGS